VSEFFLIGEYLAKAWLSRALFAPGQHTAKNEESARNNHVLACNFAKYSPILFFFTRRLNNKPFLIWLLTTPPYHS